MTESLAERPQHTPVAVTRRNFPAGPRGLTKVRLAQHSLFNTLPALEEMQREYGDIVGMRLPGASLVAMFHPADIEELLVTHRKALGKGPLLKRWSRIMGTNLITVDGEDHARRRRIANPMFRPRDVAAQAHFAAQSAQAITERWTSGSDVDINIELEDLLIVSIGRALFGEALGETEDIRRLVTAGYKHMPAVINPAYPLYAKLMRAVDRNSAEFDALIEAIMDRSVDQRAQREDAVTLFDHLTAARDEDGGDGLTRHEINQELRGFLLAGHDTTSCALAWTFQLLSRNTAARDRVVEEVARVVGSADIVTPEHVGELTFTRAVLEESLRLYGGAYDFRYAMEDVHLNGGEVVIPKGTNIMTGTWCVHRDPRWWPEPLAFRPERFLEPDPDRPKYAFMPFGGGDRRCLGQHLALQSSMTIIAEFHRRWVLDAVDHDPIGAYAQLPVRPSRAIMLRPRRLAD